MAELGAERDALRHSEAELGRRLETAREVCWQFYWLLLGTYRPDLTCMCMCVYVQDASGKGRLVVELESQLACLERQMSDEREVWRRAELTSERERVALQQALSESSQNQWRVEMESEAVSKRRSTVSLDLDLTREIDHLNKVRLFPRGGVVPLSPGGRVMPLSPEGGVVCSPVSHPCQELNVLKEDNARLTACLLQQGKALASPLHVSPADPHPVLLCSAPLVYTLLSAEFISRIRAGACVTREGKVVCVP